MTCRAGAVRRRLAGTDADALSRRPRALPTRQAFGDGPCDLVFVPGFISHIELAWEEPYLARFCGGLRPSLG